jgi:hypothetical protein
LLTASCAVSNARPPKASYHNLDLPALQSTIVSIPFSLSLSGAQASFAHSRFMDTTQELQWKAMDCKALAVIGVPAGFACGLYRTVGPLIGGVTDYRYKIAPDRSSLAVRSNIGEIERLRAARYVCTHVGNGRRDLNP